MFSYFLALQVRFGCTPSWPPLALCSSLSSCLKPKAKRLKRYGYVFLDIHDHWNEKKVCFVCLHILPSITTATDHRWQNRRAIQCKNLFRQKALLGLYTHCLVLFPQVEGLFARAWCSRAEGGAPIVPYSEKSVQYVHIRGLNRDGREELESPE